MRRSVTVLIALLLLVGCRSRSPRCDLSGTITYKGQPVNGASLTLIPTGGKGQEVLVPVGQDGTFNSADVPVGDYKVVVEGSPGNPGPSTKGMTPDQLAKMKDKLAELKTPATIKFPDKYKQPEKTDLKVTATPGQQTVTLELKD